MRPFVTIIGPIPLKNFLCGDYWHFKQIFSYLDIPETKQFNRWSPHLIAGNQGHWRVNTTPLAELKCETP